MRSPGKSTKGQVTSLLQAALISGRVLVDWQRYSVHGSAKGMERISAGEPSNISHSSVLGWVVRRNDALNHVAVRVGQLHIDLELARVDVGAMRIGDARIDTTIGCVVRVHGRLGERGHRTQSQY